MGEGALLVGFRLSWLLQVQCITQLCTGPGEAGGSGALSTGCSFSCGVYFHTVKFHKLFFTMYIPNYIIYYIRSMHARLCLHTHTCMNSSHIYQFIPCASHNIFMYILSNYLINHSSFEGTRTANADLCS